MTRVNAHIVLSDGTAWPDPLDPGQAAWHLLHSREHGNAVMPWDGAFGHDVITAYKKLIFMSPTSRERTVQEIMSHLKLPLTP